MHIKIYKILLFLILFIGVFFRVGEYFPSKSLWIDEVVVHNKIASSSVFELAQIEGETSAQTLAYPIGFLSVVKLFLIGLGNTEYALRLYSILLSIISLFLFH